MIIVIIIAVKASFSFFFFSRYHSEDFAKEWKKSKNSQMSISNNMDILMMNVILTTSTHDWNKNADY